MVFRHGRVLSLISISLLMAAPPVFAEAETPLSSPRDVLDAAVRHHPDIRRAELALEQSRASGDVAKQRPNPELDAKSTAGKSGDEKVSSMELNLAHTFELGGKRSARIGRARSEEAQREAELALVREKVYVETFLSLLRLRQTQSELGVLDEALAAYARLEKQFKSRPRLSPEQEVSLSVFQMVAGDARLKRAGLAADVEEQVKAVELAIGRDFRPTPSLLPPEKKEWPSVDDQPGDLSNGAEVKAIEAALEGARKDADLAGSAAWPDLRVGPTLESQSQGGESTRAVGGNLSLALPLYHWNGGGRRFAEDAVRRAEWDAEVSRREARAEWTLRLGRYRGAVAALAASPSPLDLERKRRGVQEHFDRGVLSTSLLIEVHRQWLDLVHSRNERELSALESLARLYALEGRLLKETL
jgi:outer membrane protein, heavy metal efflux system